MRVLLILMALCASSLGFAQTTISGTVTDRENLPIPGANITVDGESSGAISDNDGNFTLTVQRQPPFSITITSIGFASQTVAIVSTNQQATVRLFSENTELDEIVISASRTPERVLESPVTIERMSLQEIKNTSSPSFYDGLENLKEVHFNTSSLSFKSINTRGFASVANTRFLQLVDGMDNSSPALNFVLGNLVGLSELDVASVELLPGASSALYGANAFNGILFMNSKNPFTHQGISTYFKYGKTSQDAAGTNDYYDFGIRAAHAFTDKFAAKANFTYMRATEWIANDTRSMTLGGVGHAINPNYDGLNNYGDEITTFIPNVGQVSRTGYMEEDLNDNKIESVKADISLHFRPFADDFEIVLQEKVGLGSTIYQGANRYALKNFRMNQVRLELRNRNFFVRGYMTTESAGDSYDMRFAGWNIQRLAKDDQQWFTQYGTAYQLATAFLGATGPDASAIARNFADYNILPTTNGFNTLPQFGPISGGEARFEPGSEAFQNALNAVTSNADLRSGAKFKDNSKIYHAEGNYNFKELIEVAEIQLGGSFRQYALNSDGTIFTDYDGVLRYEEYGAYAQVQKKFANDKLKFTGSVRYDKAQNYDGQLSPRISFVYTDGERRNHNFRVSFQTGFRNPTTQDQYIGLDVGPFALIGSAENNLGRYVETLPVSAGGQLLGAPAMVTYTGYDAYNVDLYTANSVAAFAVTQNPNDLVVDRASLVKPEQVKAFEVGYKSILENGLSIDVNAYYNIYDDFMNTARLIKPYYGEVGTDMSDPQVLLGLQAIANRDRRVFQVYTNTSETVNSFGFGIGLSKKFFENYEVGVSYNHAQFDFDQAKDPSFVAGFNTPKHRVKASLGNANLFQNFGFNVNVRWSDEYLWQSSFGDGLIPEVTVFDAQVSYAIPSIKSMIKLGGSNLFGGDYLQVIGAGKVGRMLFAQITINP